MRPSPLIHLPALPANATSDSHRSLYPYGGFLDALRLAPPINHPACLRIRRSTTRLLCPFGAAFRPTCSSRCTINLPAQPVDPTSDSSTVVFSGGAFQLIFRLSPPINLPACLLFHLRLSSPIACLAPPSNPTNDLLHGYRFGSRPRLSTAADSRCTVARPPRRPESVAPRISLPLAASYYRLPDQSGDPIALRLIASSKLMPATCQLLDSAQCPQKP
jgi:hypothetical protein